MSTERLTGRWSEAYIGPRVFTCPACKVEYTHDKAYTHFVDNHGGTHERGAQSDPHRIGQRNAQPV